jgi:tRNA modification GTPase
MDLETTIVAISSPNGKSSHALIRASGPNAWDGAKKLGLQIESRKLLRGIIQIGESPLPVFVGAFPANASFTAQDTIEITMVNNSVLIDAVLKKLIAATGGRFAEAGEFTARAFLNNNISLSAAEGVCATISANNDAELAGAALLRGGALAKTTEPISSEIVRVLALVEAGIDFIDEEDVVAISETDLRLAIEHCIKQITDILDRKISMATLRNLPQVVLAGEPNAGKSTLFNALLGKRRTVVSGVSGTTRDAIIEYVNFHSKEALLVDVAGCDKATDALTSSVQEVAQQTMKNADVVIWCVAPGGNPDDAPIKALVVHTKGDQGDAHRDALSAITGNGVNALRTYIASELTKSPTPHKEALALLPRHENSLQETLTALLVVLQQIRAPELAATSLREALNAIGAITGQVTPDEIVGEVFSTFCIGK